MYEWYIGTELGFLLPAECIILHPHGRAQGGIGDAGPGVVSVSGALWCVVKSKRLTL